MYCPDDHLELNRLEKEGIEIYKCSQCGGLWIPLKTIEDKNTLILPKRSSDLYCFKCQKPMKEKMFRDCSIIVCDACQYAWVNGQIMNSLFERTDKIKITNNNNFLEILVPSESYSAEIVLEILVDLTTGDMLKTMGEKVGEVGETVVEFFSSLFLDIS